MHGLAAERRPERDYDEQMADKLSVWVDSELCTGCGICAEEAPDVFAHDTDDKLCHIKKGSERLTEEGFLRIAERVMPRRGIDLTAERRASLSASYRRLTAG